ncbi:MAG TPA: undecaprenyldiphospho-muramoylpentapeptide beta-N-acetylglucosaminyltransferase [Nitrospiria bacterium]|nr:undecaprenyldiphospho-muramoylpentapeptide beta-N-acetylglucosaminyltransferase [Nitrospiria bacterium]
MRVLIAAGGTGGHLFPGLAIAQEWQRRRAVEVVFAGTARGLESKLLPTIGYRLVQMRVEGWIGRGRKTLGAVLQLPRSLWDAWRLLRDVRPDVVIGTGGYASGPLLLMAALGRYPSVVVEPNVLPGLTNRLLAPLVDVVISAFERSNRHLWARRVLVLGNPIRRDVVQPAGRPATGADHSDGEASTRTVLVLGGSQGAHAINQLMVETLDELGSLREAVWFIHQTGVADLPWVRQAYDRRGVGGRIEPFIHDMGTVYAQADLVISRAGATTIAELTACGKPALLIPLPHAAHQHQHENARLLQDAGAAIMCEQGDLTGRRLAELLSKLLGDPGRLRIMADASRALGRPDAAGTIVEACEALLGVNRGEKAGQTA